MKKLLVSFLMVFTMFSLSACEDNLLDKEDPNTETPGPGTDGDGDGVSQEVLDAFKANIIELVAEYCAIQHEDLEGYLEDWDNDYFGYTEYLGRNHLTPGLLDHFTKALVKAEFTAKQFEAATEAIEDAINYDYTNGTPEDLSLILIESFFTMNVEGDQIINGFYYTITGLDTVIADLYDSVPEKDEEPYKEWHDELVSDVALYLSEYTLFFNLTDTDRLNALTIGKVTLDPVLNYVNSFESTLDDLLNMTELTQANLTTILKSERDSFKASFGSLTTTDFENAFNAVNSLNENILGSTEEMLDDATIEFYSNSIVEIISAVEEMFDVICKDVYQSELHNVLTDYDFTEQGDFVSYVLIAELIVAVENNLSDATVALIEEAYGIDTTLVFATSKLVVAIGADVEYANLTAEQLASYEAFCDAFVALFN